MIQVSNGSFATLFDSTVDTTNASTTTWQSGSINFDVDPMFVGEIVQFGFSNTAANNEDSSRFYDNVSWAESDGFGTPYCMVNPNSTGMMASLTAMGSPIAANNDFMLLTTNVPPFAFGFYLNSDVQGFVANVGTNGSGNLCLGGSIGRFQSAGQIINAGAAGTLPFPVDLTQIPRGAGLITVMAGETWNFQSWYRDVNVNGSSSNLSNGLEVTFQ